MLLMHWYGRRPQRVLFFEFWQRVAVGSVAIYHSYDLRNTGSDDRNVIHLDVPFQRRWDHELLLGGWRFNSPTIWILGNGTRPCSAKSSPNR